MDRRLLLGTLASALALPVAGRAASPASHPVGDLRLLMADAEAKGFNGQVELSIRGASVISGAWGWADAAHTRRLERRDRFHVASLSKLLTATAIMKAVESGRRSPSDTVSRFFP